MSHVAATEVASLDHFHGTLPAAVVFTWPRLGPSSTVTVFTSLASCLCLHLATLRTPRQLSLSSPGHVQGPRQLSLSSFSTFRQPSPVAIVFTRPLSQPSPAAIVVISLSSTVATVFFKTTSC